MNIFVSTHVLSGEEGVGREGGVGTGLLKAGAHIYHKSKKFWHS